MSLRNISLSKIRLEHVQQLVSDGTHELRDLDWKLTLPGRDNEAKKEFARDVVSMANAGGGDLVYGVAENSESRRPVSIDGVEIAPNWDEERLRLQNMIIANTSPRIIGFDFHQIELVNNKSVVIVRIPRSLYAPHMVSLDADYRFYMRHPGGKHRMDAGELKHAFLQSANFVDRAKTWSDQRIELIKNGIGPTPLEDGPILILHMLPLAFSTSNPFSRDEVQRIKELGLLGLDYSAEGRYNVDGYLVYKVFASQESLLSASYLQVFRDYHLEAASSYILSYDEKKLFRFPTLERSLIEKIGRYLTYLRDNEVPPPVMVRLILLNAKGFGIWYRRMSIDDGRFPKLFDRDQIVLPDVQIENWDHLDNPDVVVRPLLDSYWNATGWPNSPSYNSNGRWEDQSPNAANWDL